MYALIISEMDLMLKLYETYVAEQREPSSKKNLKISTQSKFQPPWFPSKISLHKVIIHNTKFG